MDKNGNIDFSKSESFFYETEKFHKEGYALAGNSILLSSGTQMPISDFLEICATEDFLKYINLNV